MCLLADILISTGERLEKAVVRAGTNHNITENGQCGSPVTAAQAQPFGATVEIQCETPIKARYVSVDIPSEQAILQLCEVTVEEILPE